MAFPNSTLPDDTKEAQDSLYNPGEHKTLLDGSHESIPNYDRANDGIDALDPDNDSAAGVREAESNGAGFYRPSPEGKKKKKKTGQKNFFVRRGGIIGLITTIVVGGGITGTVLLSPLGIFASLGNTFTSAFDDSAPALSIRANALMRVKIASVGSAFEESSDGKCNIKCKFGTVSEQMKNNLDSPTNDFHAEFGDKKFGGRYTIKSLTFPDGTVVSTKSEFDNAMKDVGKLSDFNKAFNNRIKFFVNGSKFATSLKNIGLDRLPKLKGSNPEEINTSLRAATGASGDSAASDGTTTVDDKESSLEGKLGDTPTVSADSSTTAALSTKLKIPAEKAGKLTDALGAICLAYDTTQISIAATKALKVAAFAGFAIAFLQIKDEIQNGTADGNVVEAAGKQLTEGATPPDSAAILKQAQNGDAIKSTSKFTLSPSSGFAVALAAIGGVIGVSAVARAAAHTACSGINNPAAPVFQCLPEIIGGLAEAGVGAVVNAVACVGINVAAGAVIGAGIGAAIPLIVQAIAKNDLTIPDETTKGGDAIQVIGLGTQQSLIRKDLAYGLHPATSKQQIQNYEHATMSAVDENKAVADYDAKDDPFDVNNPDTFLGTLVNKLNLAGYKNGSLLGDIGNTFGLIPRSFAAASSTIYADAGYPLGYDKANLYSTGNSPSLDAIGVVSSSDGVETYVMNQNELDMDPFTAIDTLTAANDIDPDTGDAIPGSNFDKWTKYCGIDRVDPMGETSGSISDDDYEWEIGAQCTVDNPEMEAIHVYTMDSAINDTLDGTGGTSSTTSTDDEKTVSPVPSGTQLNNDFSAADPGVFFPESVGKPVYAITDGEVSAIDKTGTNTVSITNGDGTVSQYLYMDTSGISVNVGDKVKAGQQIGTAGSTGITSGGLGFRVYIDGVDLTKNTAIAGVANTAANIIKTDHTYISPTSYMALFGVALGS